jgi:hypothetical protein
MTGDLKKSAVTGQAVLPTGRTGYDYACGVDEPITSSTSPHAKLNFYRQQE